MQNLSQTDLTPAKEDKCEVKRVYEDDTDEEPESIFYVEKETRLIYEVKLIGDAALIRPAHPSFTDNIEKLDLFTFSQNFEEFYGDEQVVRDFLWGKKQEALRVEKK